MVNKLTIVDEPNIIRTVFEITRSELERKGVDLLVEIAKKADISYVPLLISTAYRYLSLAFQLWPKYEQKLKKPITMLLNIIYSKISLTKTDHLFHALDPLRMKLKKYCRIQPRLLSKSEIIWLDTDQKMSSLVEQERRRTQNGNVSRFQQIKNEQDYIIDNNQELGNNHKNSRIAVLKELAFKIKLHYENQRDMKLNTSVCSSKNQKLLTEKVQSKTILRKDCLGCISFLYKNDDINFPVPKQPVTYFGSTHSIKNMSKEIGQKIVSYLNGKGGILIIGVEKNQLKKIVPIIEEIAEFHKQQHQNRLQAIFAGIFPKLNLTKQIEIRFIPVAVSNPNSLLPEWIKGAYVLRIVVTPLTQPHKAYYYKSIDNVQTYSKYTPNGDQQLKGQAIYEFMKERYRQYDPAKHNHDLVLREKGNITPCIIYHTDSCREVERGDPQFGQNHYYRDTTDRKAVDLKFGNPLMRDREGFKNISLLVCIVSLKNQILKLFKDDEKLECQIDTAFPNQKFKLSNNTFLIYHNCKFEKLLNGLKKKKAHLKQQNEKKDIILISTLPTLQIHAKAFKQQIQRQLQAKVKQVSKEKIEIKKIYDETFIKCNSIITAVYIYYYLNHHHNIKAKFEKQPQGSAKPDPKKNKNSNSNKDNRQRAFNNNRGSDRGPQGLSDEEDEEWNQRGDYDDQYQRYPDFTEQEADESLQKEGYDQESKFQFQAAYEEMNTSQPEVVEPKCIGSNFDTNGYTYYYYDNGICYIYNSLGQLYSSQYYPMTQ